MAEITLTATRRMTGKRTDLKAVRRAGKIPGVYYLHEEANIPIQVDALAMRPVVYTSEAHIINLKLDDAVERKCILREVQFDPITDRITHFDLVGLRAGEKIRLEIPVLLTGTAIGVKEGGIVQHTLHKIEVECLPSDLPEHISVKIDDLHLGDAVKIGDLEMPNLVFTLAPEQVIVSIVHPRIVAEPTPGEAPAEEAAAEPEVIAKGKKEEETEE